MHHRLPQSTLDAMKEPFLAATEDLTVLADRIKTDFPESVSFYNSLLLHAHGHARAYSFYTLKAAPHSHVIMWCRSERNEESQKTDTWLALHCRKEEVVLLTEALHQTRLLDWEGRLCIYHVPEYLKNAVQAVAAARTGQELDPSPCYTFVYQPQLEEPIRSGVGLRVYRLGRKGVRHMLDTSKFDKKKNFDEMLHLVRSAPSAGVYEDPSVESEAVVDAANLPFGPEEETPVAWITTSFYGALAILMTEERHRGRGLAKLVTQVAARMLAGQGYVPHAHVEAMNVPSVMMFKSLPGWQEMHGVYFMHRV
ncbi:uncharacterized protein LOC125025886 isoform X2 [Penaeus chinensis]|uniref:uncharacterized protein LOC125025886 isoform X2 n=1 Tax=Penaeus chinensis TaxID=139456 RepID=UPI001FB5F365|nr:uncharacterized protein LOC125025886 isoform X2 [Penaeus chinensis]